MWLTHKPKILFNQSPKRDRKEGLAGQATSSPLDSLLCIHPMSMIHLVSDQITIHPTMTSMINSKAGIVSTEKVPHEK